MSGFLSEDDFQKADGMIKDTFPVDDDGDGFIGEPIEMAEETEEDIEESSVTLEEEDVNQGDSGEEEQYADGHRVPYRRFKSVLDARNGYKNEIESLRERNRELEAYLASKPSSPGHEPEEDSYEDDDEDYGFGDDDYDDFSAGYDDKRVKQLEGQMHDLRVQHHKQQLMRDMEIIKEKFPNVPTESVLRAVANDPSTNVFQIAEGFNSFLVEREEAAIQRYIKENPQAAPDAAPRPRKSGGASKPGSSRVPKNKRPKHLKDVRNALLNHIRDNNLF